MTAGTPLFARSALKRLRAPLALALCAILIQAGLSMFSPDARVTGPFLVAARILSALAVGWAVYQIGDAFLAARLGGLRLDVADNLKARQIATRLRVLRRMWGVLILVMTVAAAMTAIPWARQIGVSIFASAGIAGIALGIAAQPVLSNLIAGLQIAFSQPMRLDDAVVVENEWGWIEEIGMFHVVIKLWDRRRLVVPLKYFIDQPFQNWTRRSASIIGSVFWEVDYRAPLAAMRERLEEIVRASPLWDGEVVVLQVTEAERNTIQLRALASARTSPEAWDLRCHIREQMIVWLQQNAPDALPRVRAEAALSRARDEESMIQAMQDLAPQTPDADPPPHDPSLETPAKAPPPPDPAPPAP